MPQPILTLREVWVATACLCVLASGCAAAGADWNYSSQSSGREADASTAVDATTGDGASAPEPVDAAVSDDAALPEFDAGPDAEASDATGPDDAGEAPSDALAEQDASPIDEVVELAEVWSGHPVHFDLVTHGTQQFVAFYDAERQLTVGGRSLGDPEFELVRLPSMLGWDSHNDVVLAVDEDGYLHVAGNMHSSPLTYFRSTRPLDVTSFGAAEGMVGRNEQACTYPQFVHSTDGQLFFMYRSGESGDGNHIFNAYDPAAQSWERVNGAALTDGQGRRNAYPEGPVQGPDGLFHLVWVWRDTPDAGTNHDLSYARSSDLTTWQGADGEQVPLPITLATGDIVDPVRSGGGMINNNTRVGFDAQGRPIVSYHKFDANGFTQLFNARFEAGKWESHQTSHWQSRWDFGGGGTLVFEVVVEPVEVQADGTLVQRYYNANEGGVGAFRLDPDTLEAVETIAPPTPYPMELSTAESPVSGMEVHFQADRAAPGADGLVYVLRWETLPANQDQPRSPIPSPTPLRLYGLRP